MIQIPLKKFDAVAGDVAIRSSQLDYLDFTQLYTESGDKLHSNLSRMVVVVWLFVALIITQSYTASFTSMLTAQRLEPTITNIEVLRNTNATVGY
ncbi:glutamate receptor 2.9-like [Helianthus annuus]|uniref:glutamate receptor 2.9-like n=1 Tax=Helianthus annuus TaxID=4232 RepID=UPI0016533684|nr:glutamate receptor 2.9-like [Helianthus annuus]